jgi:DNA-damage-inducible protein J
LLLTVRICKQQKASVQFTFKRIFKYPLKLNKNFQQTIGFLDCISFEMQNHAKGSFVMTQSSMLHIRIENEIKVQASEALEAMGLSVSDAVRIFLKRVVNDQAFPLELKVPNATTMAAMKESRAKMKAGKARFESAKDLINGLEKNSKQ